MVQMQNREESERLYGHYLDGFIREVNPATSREEILSQMNIHPIFFEKILAGIIGMTVHQIKGGALATIRLIYLEQQYRGDKMETILQQLFDKLSSEGFTHVESWALPHIATWLETRWKIKPRMFVFHENLNKLKGSIVELKKLRAPANH